MPVPIPLILSALQLGGSAVSGIQGNQNRQKAKGQIDQSYRVGRGRLATRHGDMRRGQAESMTARGLTGGGFRLRTAPVQRTGAGDARPRLKKDYENTARQIQLDPRYVNDPTGRAKALHDATRAYKTASASAPTGVTKASVTGAHTLGEQQSLDLQREQQVEQDALYQQRNAARAGVDAGYTQGLINTVGSGVAGAINDYGIAKQYEGAFGVDPTDPLGRGAWATPQVDSLNIFTQSG